LPYIGWRIVMAVNPFYPTVIHYRFRYWKSEPLWDDKTVVHRYQDGNVSFNELSDFPSQEWKLIYEFDRQVAEHAENLKILDAHFYERRKSRPFSFTEKGGLVIPNCYYKEYQPDHEGNKSLFQTRTITIVCYEYIPPDIPTIPVLSGVPNSETDVLLSWTPSIDNVAVTGYEVRLNSAYIVNVGNVLSYLYGSLTAGQTYDFEVRALDEDGHVSGWSNVVSITVPGGGVPPDALLNVSGLPLLAAIDNQPLTGN
jgi:hypothetical protein